MLAVGASFYPAALEKMLPAKESASHPPDWPDFETSHGLLETGGLKTRAFILRLPLNNQRRLASGRDVNVKGVHVQGQHGVVAHHGGCFSKQLGAEVV